MPSPIPRLTPPATGCAFRTHIVSADGTGIPAAGSRTDVAYDGAQSDWSNDGTRLVVVSGDATTARASRVIMSVAGDAPPVKIPCEPIGRHRCPKPTPGSGRRMTPCLSAPCPQMTVRRRTTSPIPRLDGSRRRSGPGPANRTGSDPHPDPPLDAGRHRWPASHPTNRRSSAATKKPHGRLSAAPRSEL